MVVCLRTTRQRTFHPVLSDTECISSSETSALLLLAPLATLVDVLASKEVSDDTSIAEDRAHRPWTRHTEANADGSRRMTWTSIVWIRACKIRRSSSLHISPTNHLHTERKLVLMVQRGAEVSRGLQSTEAGRPRFSSRLLLLVLHLAILPCEVFSTASSFSLQLLNMLRV